MIKGFSVGINNLTNELYLTVYPVQGEAIFIEGEEVNTLAEHIEAIKKVAEAAKPTAEKEKDSLIEIINDKTTDEEKVALIDIYEEWKNLIGKTVNVDTFFKHEGTLYRVIKDNTIIYEHYLPQETPSEYEDMTKKMLQPDGSYPLWVKPISTLDGYKIGDRVQHNGFDWECSQGDADGINMWEPGVYGWKQI